MKRMLNNWKTAVRFLTILPAPGDDCLPQSLPWFPAVGAGLGLAAAGTAWLLSGWPAGAGAAGAALAVILTGGLHVDGLGDAADGLLGGRTREQKLAIMKDPRAGSFAVAAITLDLLVKAAAIGRLAAVGSWCWIAVPFIASRSMLVRLATAMPYARPEGGTAGPFVRNPSPLHWPAAAALGALLCMALAGPGGLAAFALGTAAAACIARFIRKTLGGITGDLLGMSNELLETGLLFLAAIFAPYLHYADWRLFL